MLRSNENFQKRGLEHRLQYELDLSTSRNPDFVVKHPNETKEKNPANWKKEITTRITREEETRQKVLAVRLKKHTSHRRLNV